MFKNYFKIAWRNIRNNKVYSSLNIFGLATGMAVALLIGLWVYDQYSYDTFLPGYQQAYRVQRNFNSNGDTLTFLSTSLKLADALRSQVPEIKSVAECDGMGSHGLLVGDKKMYLKGAQIGSDFLTMFRYPLLQGNANKVLSDPYSIVLTASAAEALFGNQNPVGKTVRFDNENNLKVTGVLQDLPRNSSLSFDFLVPFSYMEQNQQWVKEARNGRFDGNSFNLYVQLKEGVSLAQVAPKIMDIEHIETGNTNAMNSYVTLQPLARWHLYSNYVNGKDTPGFLVYVRMFTIIGILVLLIACINFVNLITARSEKRAKEVGVRKAIGSLRRDLIIQFLSESFLFTFLAFLLCLLFVQLALSPFNALTGSDIAIPYTHVYFWMIVLSCVCLTALVAGSRPAFYLSSFQPVIVLKGGRQTGRASSLPRKILVVTQFSCSIALIISTVIIYQQIQYAKDRPSGYDINRLLMTNMNSDLNKNYAAIKNEMIQKGIAESVTTATSPATDVGWHMDLDYWPGKQGNETVEMGTIITTPDYFKTVGMKMAEGRDFTGANDTASVVFNETAIKRLRLKNPVGQMIRIAGQEIKIAGVVKDALMISPFAPADPTMFYCNASPKYVMLYKLSPNINTHDAIVKLTALFNKYNPAYPYSYEFADDSYAAKFNLETLIGKLAGVFAGLAIFISCLGLFGLAAYIAEERTKEIGIRKVLGASVPQVWLLLSKDFVVLVLISCFIASPVAFYFLQHWLQNYNYRITISPFVFIAAGLASVFITIVTVSFQAIKAAIANPVKSLRTE